MKYIYLIYYTYATGQGRLLLDLESPINHENKIKEIEKYIVDNYGKKNPCICNFQLLRTETTEETCDTCKHWHEVIAACEKGIHCEYEPEEEA